MNELDTFCPADRQQWRQWLQENHETHYSVWLIYYKKKANKATITWSDAVSEALCFGWIDSKLVPLDDERSMQFFSKRKPNSAWSKINKDKVEQLLTEGLMTPAGLKSINIAKQNGSWTILDEVEQLIIPPDLDTALDDHPGSREFFTSLSKSVKKRLLQWLVFAKREETRQKRVREIVEFGEKGLLPKGV